MVFPWILALTLLLIPFSVFLTSKALLHYSVSAAAERAAFAWPHASSDLRTGAYSEGRYDSLYWRMNEDALLAGLFGWKTDEEVGAAIGRTRASDGGGPVAAKLAKTAGTFEDGVAGTVSYRNRVWKREITVAASGRGLFDEAEASAAVTEPAETIRTFELVRRYRDRFRKPDSGAFSDRQRAAAVLERRR